jgi:response regulator RpfG family c-di-GMP phosphodiesterase
MSQRRTVLLLLDRRGANLIKRRLLRENYVVLETYTTDHAVAVCVNQPVDAAVQGQDLFVETEGWSVAQSLKAVKSHLCVILISKARRLTKKLPKGIDAIITGDDTDEVVSELDRLID